MKKDLLILTGFGMIIQEILVENNFFKVKIKEYSTILIKMKDEIFIIKAVSIVRQRIDDPSFGKEKFAQNMNVSSSLLYKKIKNLTSLSPTTFVKLIRLDYATELLKSGEYSVTEISEKIGFASIGYFSTEFKKYYGMSPSKILRPTILKQSRN